MLFRVKSGLERAKPLTLAQRTSPFFTDCPRIGIKSVPPYGFIDMTSEEIEPHEATVKRLLQAQAIKLALLREDGSEEALQWDGVNLFTMSKNEVTPVDEPEVPEKPEEPPAPAPKVEVSDVVQAPTDAVTAEAVEVSAPLAGPEAQPETSEEQPKEHTQEEPQSQHSKKKHRR